MLSFLPTLNATLNAASAILLIIGHSQIKSENRAAHKSCMIGAFTTSILFLISYLTYHAMHGTTNFTGQGWIRPLYFTILISHTILAAVVVPLAVMTLRRGLRDNIAAHRKIARWTYPIWLYVSVTGVVIYLALYHLPS